MHTSRLMRAIRRTLATSGAVAGAALVAAGMASAADQVQLKSRMAGNWCFDAPNGNNTATVVNTCNGAKSQLWTFTPSGQIESAAFPGQCVNIANAADNTPVTLAPCQTNANQQWNHQPDGQLTSALGPCLNISGGVAQPANPVIAYHCIANVDDEQWDSAS